MSEQLLLSPKAAAAYLGLAPSTLAKWRVDGTGPTYLKLGSAVRYKLDDLSDWLDSRSYSSTSATRSER
ncbi:helix-turn-helix domain-containing protein [Hyphobacterium sp. SN044]|uniref:helix-turn-helix transcriptional regulator n=1 Tax=Hyphobacterium sp. SN044 TaxID=2912575 RepID=UPI001F3C8C58|nr:helix-turn-helix domain-containing protein [Hyphobacterium sp. SN044]MCF8879653.1 helix-turn-helix domain-containing protein [Hyphobacterium sp. SN044]